MPLEFAVVQAPFRLGVEEGIDPHYVPVGTLTRAENVEWRKQNRVQKRRGTTAITKSIVFGASITAGARLFNRGGELSLIDGTNVYAYSPAYTGWKSVDKVPEVGLTWSPLIDSFSGVLATDIALSSTGMLVHAWVNGDPTASANLGDVWFQVIEYATGAILMPPTQVTTGSNVHFVKVAIVGTTAVVFYQQTTNLVGYQVNLGTLSVGGATNLRTDVAAATSSFDAISYGSLFYVGYEYSGAAPKIRFYAYDTTLTQQATGSLTGEAGNSIRSLSMAGQSSETIHVAYFVNSTGNVRYATIDTSIAQVTAPVIVETIVSQQVAITRFDASNAIVSYTTSASSPGRFTSAKVSNAGTVTATTVRRTWGASLAARPFMLGGKCYAPICDFAQTSTSVFSGISSWLVECDTSTTETTNQAHRYVGKVDTLIGGQPINGTHPNCIAVSSTEVIYPGFFQASAPSVGTSWRQGCRLVSATIGASLPKDMWKALTYGKEAFITAGVPHAYDGRIVFDYGFLRAPVWKTQVISTPAGAIVLGSYLYGFVLEFRSTNGMLYRSPVGTTTSPVVIAATPSQVVYTLTAPSTSTKTKFATGVAANTASPVELAVYRTVVNGTTPQRLTLEPTANVVYFDSTQQTQGFTDTRADASIDGASTTLASRPAIYTGGGAYDDDQPPSLVTWFLHKSRIFALDGGRQTFWYTKSFQEEIGVAPGFSVNFRIPFDERMTGGESMDDKAVFFSEKHIWYMPGDGPTATGASNDFGTPARIQSDVGCTNSRSLVAMPDGIMFQAAPDKLYLLTRGLELQWIGRPVRDTLLAYPNITSAVLVPTRNQVRFTCNNEAASAGVVLVFDYQLRQWSVSKYYDSSAAVASTPIADACLWNGVWTYLTPGGAVFTETDSSFFDDSQYVSMLLETAWITAAPALKSETAPLAFKSVRNFALQGISNTNHNLTIDVGFDGEATYAQTATFLAGSDVTAVGDLEDCDITINTRRKCNAIRFRISDATPTNPGVYPPSGGQGPSFDSMGIEVGTKRGTGNVPATRRA